jgi:mono/diheme cytochrome c family protein
MTAVYKNVRTLAAALLCTAAAGASAQTGMEEGKKLFTQGAVPACAVCHTLAHAGATGEIGPVLDELKPDAARVEKAIRNGIGQMPAFQNLSDAQIKELARYVATASGGGK